MDSPYRKNAITEEVSLDDQLVSLLGQKYLELKWGWKGGCGNDHSYFADLGGGLRVAVESKTSIKVYVKGIVGDYIYYLDISEEKAKVLYRKVKKASEMRLKKAYIEALENL